MKIMVCGPIAYGDIKRIKELQKFLKEKGFEVIDQFQRKEMDYSNIKDFRTKGSLREK